MSGRLSLAIEAGAAFPEAGRVGVFNPVADYDLSAISTDRGLIIQPFFPDHEVWRLRGYTCVVVPDATRFVASVVNIPRAKTRARMLIAQAMERTNGPVFVDGAKTDGIDGLLKEMRTRGTVAGSLSKAHGKVFWTHREHQGFPDWQAAPETLPEGFVTAPGVFSADAIDPASRLLVQSLPQALGRHVVDLGAGWGYLSANLLKDPELAHLDLVEADHAALTCARKNVDDPRAHFHWADALNWAPDFAPQAVVMNPPFHTGRSGDPGLGQAFIGAAARMLSASGTLILVANRHLPYESTLMDKFATMSEVAGSAGFKVLRADRPRT